MAKQQQPKVKADSVKKSVKVVIPQVKLYPKGSASARSVDSLKKTDPKVAKVIGKPIQSRPGSTPQYGTQSSDVIKKLLNKPAAKPQVIAKKKK